MAACGYNAAQPPSCDDCLRVVKTTKTVHVPCKYNTYKKVKVKVPRQVNEQVPRTVKYTDYETRQTEVPYTVTRPERRTRVETQKYQVPVKRCYTVMQTKEKQVEVPYYVDVPFTKYRTETQQVPVERTKVLMDTITKTVYDTQVRRQCVPQSRMCSKELPLYNVVAKPCGDCPADELVDDFSVINGSAVNGTAAMSAKAKSSKRGARSVARSTSRASRASRRSRGSASQTGQAAPVEDDVRTIGASTGVPTKAQSALPSHRGELIDGTMSYYDMPHSVANYDATFIY